MLNLSVTPSKSDAAEGGVRLYGKIYNLQLYLDRSVKIFIKSLTKVWGHLRPNGETGINQTIENWNCLFFTFYLFIFLIGTMCKNIKDALHQVIAETSSRLL